MTMTMLTKPSGPYTAADLDTMPDDGRRYELIDGTLIVTPSPAVPHQRVVGNLHVLLRQAVTPEFEVMLAPLDINVSDLTVLQPDLLVAPRPTLTGRKMVGLPVLAIEVLSPSTRLIDLRLKHGKFEELGVGYWVVDPITPSITQWIPGPQGYELGCERAVDEMFSTDDPFEVSFTPRELTL